MAESASGAPFNWHFACVDATLRANNANGPVASRKIADARAADLIIVNSAEKLFMAPDESIFMDVWMAGSALDVAAAPNFSGRTAMATFYGMQSGKTSMRGQIT